MDFVGAVVDARGALVAIPEGQRRLVGHAHRAMHLNGPVEHVLEKIGKTSLDKVIAETTSALERRCLITILQEAGGRHNIAAKVAGMPLETWMDRVKRHKLV